MPAGACLTNAIERINVNSSRCRVTSSTKINPIIYAIEWIDKFVINFARFHNQQSPNWPFWCQTIDVQNNRNLLGHQICMRRVSRQHQLAVIDLSRRRRLLENKLHDLVQSVDFPSMATQCQVDEPLRIKNSSRFDGKVTENLDD